jgi:hypothetical protein
MSVGIHALSSLQRLSALYGGTPGPSTTIRLDGSTKRIAWKFYVASTSPITHVNPNLNVGGDVTGETFTASIQADSSDAPSGTPLGAATAAWAGPASSGMIGDQALGSNTGALTVNTPYWLVIEYDSGTVDASNYIEATTHGSIPGNRIVNNAGMRCFNGTDWTTVSRINSAGSYNLTHAGGSMTGIVHTAAFGNSGATDIHGTNRQGLKWKTGCREVVLGAKFQTTKSGSPAALELVCYEGSTEKATAQLAAAEIVTNVDWTYILFSTPPTLAPDADRYLILRQASNGGDDSNDYDLRGTAVTTGTIAAYMPPGMRYVSGTGDDPTALSESSTFHPHIHPLYADPLAALDNAGGGGGVPGNLCGGIFQ